MATEDCFAPLEMRYCLHSAWMFLLMTVMSARVRQRYKHRYDIHPEAKKRCGIAPFSHFMLEMVSINLHTFRFAVVTTYVHIFMVAVASINRCTHG